LRSLEFSKEFGVDAAEVEVTEVEVADEIEVTDEIEVADELGTMDGGVKVSIQVQGLIDISRTWILFVLLEVAAV
jgi:hypothetical protein